MLPSILMIIRTSVYSIVDGFFVSNFVGKTPFAAINLIMPVLVAVGTIGFMIGTGGSAIVSKAIGEGKKEKQMSRPPTVLLFMTVPRRDSKVLPSRISRRRRSWQTGLF